MNSSRVDENFSARDSQEVEKLFYVESGKCKMRYVNPFNAEFLKINHPKAFIPCTNESDLISVHYDKILNQYVLHTNEEVLHELSESKTNDFACFYQKIIYGQSAEHYDG